MTWRKTILNIWRKTGPTLVLRTESALQIEIQSLDADGVTWHVSTIGVDLSASPGIYRNTRLVKEGADWHWYAVEPDQWCTSWHQDSDGRSLVVKTVPPPHDITQPLVWGQPKFRVEPDGTVIAKDFIKQDGWLATERHSARFDD